MNSDVRLHIDVDKRLDPFRLQVRLDVGSEILVLFGPSGAGKTMTLQSIAGLVSPDAGEVVFDGRALFRRHRPGSPANLPTRRRRVGYVFQDYALFPHLTALENVAFPLWRKDGGRGQAAALLERMRLEHLADRYPREMSGGQQQRIAIARALAAQPDILLLDEPFSALDPALRERLQRGLRDIQREFGLVVLCVTHNLEDAFAIGDRLATVHEGQVTQVGAVEEVFQRPANLRAAESMGVRNLIHARVMGASADGVTLDWDGLTLQAPPQHAVPGQMVPVYIRPEDIKLLYADRGIGEALRHNQADGTVVAREDLADFTTLFVALPNGHQIEVRYPSYTYSRMQLGVGSAARLSLRREGLVLLRGPLSP
jgi:ABC-type spermidine/putrescine transport systems, ATPase components